MNLLTHTRIAHDVWSRGLAPIKENDIVAYNNLIWRSHLLVDRAVLEPIMVQGKGAEAVVLLPCETYHLTESELGELLD